MTVDKVEGPCKKGVYRCTREGVEKDQKELRVQELLLRVDPVGQIMTFGEGGDMRLGRVGC